MTDDTVARLLSGLEEAPPVRPVFAQELREQLLVELGLRVEPPPSRPEPPGTARGRWPRLFPLLALRPVTWRGALIAALLLLLMAALAAAAGLAITRWLSAGPGAPQYTDDFRLVELYREPAAFYGDLHVGTDGRTLLAMRVPVPRPGRETVEGAIVRFGADADASGPVDPTVVLGFEQLRDPSLWDPATELATSAISRSIGGWAFDALTVAPNGDLFLAASLYPQGLSHLPGPTSVLQIRPDGSVQRVLTGSELIASGLFDRLDEVVGIGAVASAPDLLWARVEAPVVDPPGSATWLFQVVDPNADGDWSDHVIRPLVLPGSVPQMEYGVYERSYGSFVAEPSTAGRDRSRSILLPVQNTDGRLTIHRLTDTQGDGDLTGSGEAELLFDGLTSSESAGWGAPVISPRLVSDGGVIAIDDLVAGGLSRSSRVSRITPDGVVDIVRALPTWADDVEADREGGIFVTTQAAGTVSGEEADSGLPQFLLYRLDPVVAGEAASAPTPSASELPPSPSPSGVPLFELAPVTDGVPSVAFRGYGDSDPDDDDPSTDAMEALRVGVDGSGPALVIPGELVYGFCQSADGSLVVAQAETPTVPGEPFIWVASTAGGEPELVSETARVYWCDFPSESILLGTGGETVARHQTVIRHTFASGEETVIAEDVYVFGPAPDGTSLAVADDPARVSLAVIDVRTGERRVVVPPGGDTIRAAWWAPTGSMIAYLTGPPPGPDPAVEEDVALWVAPVDGGSPRELITFHAREPDVSWSADATHLLLRAPTSHHDGWVLDTPEGPLWMIDTGSGESVLVLEDGARWAGWSPTQPGTYAYADAEALTLATLDDGARHLVDRLPEPLCDVCDVASQWPVGYWLGWSPDGRQIGLGSHSGAIAVVDIVTAELLVPIVSGPHRWVDEPRWWR